MADFEKSFSDFINRREYDQAENALFSMIIISFRAGWLAAGGKVHNFQENSNDNNIPIDNDLEYFSRYTK